MEKKISAISPTRGENYPEWYQQIVKNADLAEQSDVRGCMVIKPWGYGIWENIQRILDLKFKQTGHKNAYFPLFIPLSYLEKEAKHVEGFAKECAVVTHHRLEGDGKGGLKPSGELEEPLIVRPTSETIIGATYAKWVNSWRDLPLLINQWANVVRWEMRPRIFLRTAEFLWQEGHTAHSSQEEAVEETLKMLDVYEWFAREYLAIPVIKGEKSQGERFPGAVNTYTIEAMMQDKKALQAGTSHFLGQNFSKSFDIKFQSKEGKEEFAWTTSWGVSTRLIGGLIMTHSDDNGLILPPRIAPSHLVFIPIYKNDAEKNEVMNFINPLKHKLSELKYVGINLSVEVDDRPLTGGDRSWHWIKKGIPLRIEVGMRDLKGGTVFLGRRDKEPKDKISLKPEYLVQEVINILEEIQANYLTRAQKFQSDNIFQIDNSEEFNKFFGTEQDAGFSSSFWCGHSECESAIKESLKVTIRCIPLEAKKERGNCIRCSRESNFRVLFARSY